MFVRFVIKEIFGLEMSQFSDKHSLREPYIVLINDIYGHINYLYRYRKYRQRRLGLNYFVLDF